MLSIEMDIQERHFSEFGKKPQIVVEVPQIITFFGTFADYYKAVSVSAAGKTGLTVAVSLSGENQTNVLNVVSGDRKRVSMTLFKSKKEDKWANAVRGVFSVFSGCDKVVPALCISLEGPLLVTDDGFCFPAIAVGLSLALNKLLGLEQGGTELVKTAVAVCNFCSCRTDYAYVLNMIVPEDGLYQIFDYSNQKCEYIENPFKNSQFGLFCIDSNIPSDTMQEELSLIGTVAESAMKDVKQVFGKSNLGSISTADLHDRSFVLSEESRHGLRCLIEEKNTSVSAVKSFQEKDCVQIGRLLGKNGRLLRNEAYLTCPELDWISKRIPDTFTPFSSNASVMCSVINRTGVGQMIEKLSDYDKIFGFPIRVWEFVPSSGAHIII